MLGYHWLGYLFNIWITTPSNQSHEGSYQYCNQVPQCNHDDVHIKLQLFAAYQQFLKCTTPLVAEQQRTISVFHSVIMMFRIISTCMTALALFFHLQTCWCHRDAEAYTNKFKYIIKSNPFISKKYNNYNAASCLYLQEDISLKMYNELHLTSWG